MLGGEGLVAAAPWPEADPALLVEASVTLPVQVNGKRRAEIAVPAGSDAATIEALVLQDAAVPPGAERRRAAAAGRGARPDRQCGGLTARAAPCSGAPRRRALAACGFTPLYGPGAPASRMAGGSRSRCIEGAPGFALRERLTERLGARHGADAPAGGDARRSSAPAWR